jgi:hypothetical protein
MLLRIFRRQPRRLFLGDVAALGRDTVRRGLERLASDVPASLDRALLVELIDSCPWPPVRDAGLPGPTDLAVDFDLVTYRHGISTLVSFDSVTIPLFWRPKVTLTARLYYLQSRQPLRTINVTESMPLAVFLRGILSLKVSLGTEPPAGRKELEELIRLASARLRRSLERTR